VSAARYATGVAAHSKVLLVDVDAWSVYPPQRTQRKATSVYIEPVFSGASALPLDAHIWMVFTINPVVSTTCGWVSVC
jgi:hypothetical protein